MWISKKKWDALEKRVADLEGQVQSQPIRFSENIKAQLRGSDISSALAEELKKVVVNHLD
ncbi:hypothetical protein [Enterocloster alcoholdehydrogenati]|uniref:hypothetical protein n=1 Tax=Enterocloster alcoholdehydrogenati TaxID=2547410 RepID=UPI001593ACF5|nr:hypothetical protein [Enterocloster alcoholdehydrogenati]